MKRIGIVYGLVGGILIVILRITEYKFLVVEHSLELYGGLTAVTFACLGVWLGVRVSRRSHPIAAGVTGAPSSPPPFVPDQKRLHELGLTPRELETLELIAQGLSNREIAERLFVSENTVKTHTSRVLGKLGVNRRIQAVQVGKQFGLLP